MSISNRWLAIWALLLALVAPTVGALVGTHVTASQPPQRLGAIVRPSGSLPSGSNVDPGIDPTSGGLEVYVANQSSALVSWQFAVPSTARALAPAWAQSTAVAQYDARIANGNTCVASTAGTTAATGSGPTITGADAGGLDGTVDWVCYAGATYKGQLSITDKDATNPAFVGDANLQLTVVPPNFGGVGVLPADPSRTYVSAPTGSPIVVVTGIP